MFARLIVPLDGSKVAETALPVANQLAQALKTSVLLIHIVEKNAPVSIHGDAHLQEEKTAKTYLNDMAKKFFKSSVRVEAHVHLIEKSDVATSISAHSSEYANDLIIMCAHGSQNLKTWWSGNIAQQIVSTGHTPVLLVQEKEAEQTPINLYSKFLVPLDGDPDHEQVIPLTIQLGKKFHAQVTIIAVVPTLSTLEGENMVAGRMLPSAMRETLDISVDHAQEYLRGISKKIQQYKIDVRIEVTRGDPAREIQYATKQFNADLVILGTHGRIGQNAFWAGSVASKLVNTLDTAVLVIPIH
jgi:nucleotide-binding universal stress UspA family protein